MTLSSAFSFATLPVQYEAALAAGYRFYTSAEYASRSDDLPSPVVVHLVNINFSVGIADRLWAMFDDIGIRTSFFLRLHA
jgi:hypothetical protein